MLCTAHCFSFVLHLKNLVKYYQCIFLFMYHYWVKPKMLKFPSCVCTAFSSFFFCLAVLLNNFTQKPWFKLRALTALFPFFYFFSLDIIIFCICHTYFSIFALILCSFYSLVSGFRSSKFLSFFIN